MEQEDTIIPKWLKNLQENSWELELLISGGAIFSLFQFSDLWLGWIETIRITSSLPGAAIFMIIGMFGIKILTIGFILHLSFRAFWLAMVCINFVYPSGIQKEKTKLKAPFKDNYKQNSDLQHQIMNVDKLCGTVMFMSITYAVCLIGLLFSFFVITTIPILIYENTGFGIIETLNLFLLISFTIYVLDLLSFGLLRKVPFLTYILFPFFKVFDFITLRFIYKKPLLLLHSNINKVKLISSTTLFLLFAISFTYLSVYRIMHWPNVFDSREYKFQMAKSEYLSSSCYRDENKNELYSRVNIQSKIIHDNYLEVFILYRKNYDFILDNLSSDKKDLLFEDLIKIKIDEEELENIEWHPVWPKDIEKIGITAMIPIRKLSNDKHTLSIWSYERDEYFNIPFWKDTNNN